MINLIGDKGKVLIKIAVIILLLGAISGYAFFQARNLIKGPELLVRTPTNGTTTTSSLISLSGTAKNISFISLNDRQIYVDKNGNFDEELILAPGYNVWTLQAKDKFGRIVTKKLELVFSKNS